MDAWHPSAVTSRMMVILITGGSRGVGPATAVLAGSRARDRVQP